MIAIIRKPIEWTFWLIQDHSLLIPHKRFNLCAWNWQQLNHTQLTFDMKFTFANLSERAGDFLLLNEWVRPSYFLIVQCLTNWMKFYYIIKRTNWIICQISSWTTTCPWNLYVLKSPYEHVKCWNSNCTIFQHVIW